MRGILKKHDIQKKYIAVIGSGAHTQETAEAARAIGEYIAGRGAIVICGGLSGVMDAVAEGVHKVGGTCIGILPEDHRSGASKYLTASIPTGMGEGRNVLVVKAADGIIAVGGGYGTLSEIALALKMEKPVVGLDTWTAYDNAGERTEMIYTRTPREAVETLFSLIK